MCDEPVCVGVESQPASTSLSVGSVADSLICFHSLFFTVTAAIERYAEIKYLIYIMRTLLFTIVTSGYIFLFAVSWDMIRN